MGHAMKECINTVKNFPRDVDSYGDLLSLNLPVFKTLLSDKNFQIAFLREDDQRLSDSGYTETENFK